MVQAGSTYRAVQAVSPGKLELTEKPLLDPNPGHVRIRLRLAGSAIRTPALSKECFQSSGRVSPVTRRWVASTRSAREWRAGKSANAWA
jgi:hypothetical protein